MMTYFAEVKIKGRKVGKCRCGKRRTRTAELMQTINPFNKNKRGEQKNRVEIMEEISAERSEWMAKEITCPDCPEVAGG